MDYLFLPHNVQSLKVGNPEGPGMMQIGGNRNQVQVFLLRCRAPGWDTSKAGTFNRRSCQQPLDVM